MSELLDDIFFPDPAPVAASKKPKSKPKPSAKSLSKPSAKGGSSKKRNAVTSDDEDDAAGSADGSDDSGYDSANGRAKSTVGDLDEQYLSEDDEEAETRAREKAIMARTKKVAAKKGTSASGNAKKAPTSSNGGTAGKVTKPKKPAPAPVDEAPKKSQKRKRVPDESEDDASRSESLKPAPTKKGKNNEGASVGKPKKTSAGTSATKPKKPVAQRDDDDDESDAAPVSSSNKKSKKPAPSKTKSAAETSGSKQKPNAPKSKKASSSKVAHPDDDDDAAEGSSAPAAPGTKTAAKQVTEQVNKVGEHMAVIKHPFVLKRHKHGMPWKRHGSDAIPEYTLRDALKGRLGQNKVAADAAKWFIHNKQEAGELDDLMLQSETGGSSRAMALPVNNDVKRLATLLKHAMMDDPNLLAAERNAFAKARDTLDFAMLAVATRYVAMGQNVIVLTGGSMGIHGNYPVVEKGKTKVKVEYTPGLEVLYGGQEGKKLRYMTQEDVERPLIFMHHVMLTCLHKVLDANPDFTSLKEIAQWTAVRVQLCEEWGFSPQLYLYLATMWRDFSGGGHTGPVDNVVENPRQVSSCVWMEYLHTFHLNPQAKALHAECVRKFPKEEDEAVEEVEQTGEAPEEAPQSEQPITTQEPRAAMDIDEPVVVEQTVPITTAESESHPPEADVHSEDYLPSSLGVGPSEDALMGEAGVVEGDAPHAADGMGDV